MKHLITGAVASLMLASCAYIPKKHDSDMMYELVTLRVDLDYLSCSEERGWDIVLRKAEIISRYADLRKDNQAATISNMEANIIKANESVALCEPTLNFAKLNADIALSAWKGRRQ